MIRWAERWVRYARADTDGRIRVGAKQIYILPTVYGFLYAAAVFLMLIGALNYASNLGLIFTFLFIGLGVVTILHTWRNLVHLELRIGAAPPLFAGGNAAFTLVLEELAGRARPGLQLAVRDHPQVSAGAGLAPGGNTSLVLHRPAPQRGELPLGVVRVSTSYPLGLLRAWCFVDPPATALVYPRPATMGGLRSRPDYQRSEKGDRGVGTDDFVGPRRYRPGDPPRHLDWKAFARERGLVTRQFGGDRAEQVWLDWQAAGGADSEERLRRLCRMVLDAAAADQYYGLRIPGLEIPPGAGDFHRHRCLAALARFSEPTG